MDVAQIDVDDLPGVASAWDRAVDATPDADEFCAASPWAFSAACSFPDARPPTVWTDGTSFAGLRRATTEDGAAVLVGLDPIWGFATPMVGHPLQSAAMLVGLIDQHPDVDAAVITGQRLDGYGTASLARVVGERYRLLRGPSEQRLRADLSRGVEAWALARSGRFRQRMRRLAADASTAGVTIEDRSSLRPDFVMAQVEAIEARSWKGHEATGLAAPSLADFYRHMCWALAPADGIRLLVAVHDGVDVGFILGGIRGTTYRGLQLSTAMSHGHLGLGHVLQWHQIHALEGTGVDTYDLGMDMEYKRRWADRVDETISVLVVR